MPLNDDLIKILRKTHEPSVLINMRFRGNDIAFKTDKDGNAVLLFIGILKEDGSIKGKRYVRTLKYDREGKIIKDHWELKGNAT
jgi:hypothetical protein